MLNKMLFISMLFVTIGTLNATKLPIKQQDVSPKQLESQNKEIVQKTCRIEKYEQKTY